MGSHGQIAVERDCPEEPLQPGCFQIARQEQRPALERETQHKAVGVVISCDTPRRRMDSDEFATTAEPQMLASGNRMDRNAGRLDGRPQRASAVPAP